MGDAAEETRIGGKASGLFRLLELGLPVPDFVVLTADAWREADAGDLAPVLDRAWEILGCGKRALAVRSSAIGEDGATHSFAGQMETVLNVTSRDALSAAVATCWESLHGERARVYRAQAGEAELAGMAVVIQHMVLPSAAGVVFTVNPASGRADELLASSVWGLGEGLVSGVLPADTFVLDRAGKLLDSTLADKAERIVPLAEGGTRLQPVPDAERKAPSLAAEQLAGLTGHALAAERAAGRPLDIEFAVADGELFFLQARPVTAFEPQARESDGNRQVWDNSNIVESYPGITQPLTFSFIRIAYHAVYTQFCQLLGLSAKEIRDHEHMLDHMLALINGRVYYNLMNWYRLVSLLPGFRWNKGFMEGMMGVAQGEDATDEPEISWARRWLVEFPRVLKVGLNAVRLQWRLPKMIKRFHADFDAVYQHYRRLDIESLPPHRCLEIFAELEQKILWRWRAPIVNDFSAMIFYGLLKKLTVSWGVDPAGGLHNALVSGQGDIESTEVSDQLVALAVHIRDTDAEFAARFMEAAPEAALRMLRAHTEFAPRLDAYLDRFGDRCVAELKLESTSMRDDPRFCVAMLQNYLRQPVLRDATATGGESKLCQEAEETVRTRLRGHFTRFGLPKLPLYRWVLHRARAAIRNRENQRLARTRAFALVRCLMRSIGANWSRQRLLDHAEDIFLLELSEIRAFVYGVSPSTDLRALVEHRRREYERYEALPQPPDHIVTHGSPYAGNALADQKDVAPAEGALRGLGACPGIVEAKAIVLFEPDVTLRLSGEILVTRQTDPGWVVLFPNIGGLVVERGSMLSHSAIVAREMGIPCVVGVENATDHIRSGASLRLDGGAGTVEVLP
jgi:pyruvate,water dikinase